MIRLEPHAEGVVLLVRAQAGARRNALNGVHDGALRVQVTQAPEKGKANKAILALLAARLDVAKSQIELIAGDTAPQKRFLIRGLDAAKLADRLTAEPE